MRRRRWRSAAGTATVPSSVGRARARSTSRLGRRAGSPARCRTSRRSGRTTRCRRATSSRPSRPRLVPVGRRGHVEVVAPRPVRRRPGSPPRRAADNPRPSATRPRSRRRAPARRTRPPPATPRPGARSCGGPARRPRAGTAAPMSRAIRRRHARHPTSWRAETPTRRRRAPRHRRGAAMATGTGRPARRTPPRAAPTSSGCRGSGRCRRSAGR